MFHGALPNTRVDGPACTRGREAGALSMLYLAGFGLILGMAAVAFFLKKRTSRGSTTLSIGH
jgi:hypothetical protein